MAFLTNPFFPFVEDVISPNLIAIFGRPFQVDIPILFVKTLVLRPYVFIFLAISLYSASRLLGWKRTCVFFGITWLTALVCEFSSTRIGFPFGDYFYSASTVGQELYFFNVPFMDSLSFTFLLYASYCLALLFVLPFASGSQLSRWTFIWNRTLSWPVIFLTCLFFMFIDIVIDPVALRGDRWFLGLIYGYPEPGLYFGVPMANFLGWFVVGFLAMTGYRLVDHWWTSLPPCPSSMSAGNLLLGCGLYYGVLIFNLTMTFWIGERLLGMTGIFLYVPITVLAIWKLQGWLPQPSFDRE